MEPADMYTEGRRLTVNRHHPPNPDDYWHRGVDDTHVITHENTHEVAELVIREPIKIGRGDYHQVFRCTFNENPCVVKIYDPIFYLDDDEEEREEYACPIEEACTREAHAYQQLNVTDAKSSLQLKVPQYHGSWVWQGTAPSRQVNLIAIEDFGDRTLDAMIRRRGVTYEDMINVFLATLEVDHWLRERGVTHADLAERNIIAMGSVKATKPEVRLIDFSNAIIHKFGRYVDREKAYLRKDLIPLELMDSLSTKGQDLLQKRWAAKHRELLARCQPRAQPKEAPGCSSVRKIPTLL